MLWSEKYRPKGLGEFVGNPSAVEEVRKWAIEWERKKGGKALLVAGPSGVGKSSLAYALAGSMGWEVVELNASDARDEERVGRFFAGGGAGTLFGKMRLVLVDDADSIIPSQDRGGVGAVAKQAADPLMPMIVTVEDAYDRKIASLRNYCTLVNLKRINSATVEKVVRGIAREEGLGIGEENLASIAQNAGGDLRSAINDLQAQNFTAARERERGIFDSVRGIMKAEGYMEARQLMFSLPVDHDTFKLWICENIPNEYEKREDRALAFERLSRADVFDGRIHRRQYWGLLRYSNDLMSAGVALSKAERYRKFVSYAFPSYLRSMGASKGKRALSKSIAGKISLLCHCSLPDARWYLHVLELMCRQDAAGVKFHWMLENSEIAQLLGKSEEDVEKMLGNGKERADAENGEEGKAFAKEKAAKKAKGKGAGEKNESAAAKEKKAEDKVPPNLKESGKAGENYGKGKRAGENGAAAGKEKKSNGLMGYL